MTVDTFRAGLLASIAEYCVRHGISEATFGRLVMDDSRFILRLRDFGQNVTLASLKQAEVIMKNPPVSRSRPRRLGGAEFATSAVSPRVAVPADGGV